ncbi:MAG: hypothetical protein CAF41_009880 [Nitrospira sp. CG24A]|nr:MAG: hypothetical protein CAF41_009880 [Nitrospira sp. CG24A]
MQAASELVFGREVTLQAHGHGKYKHTLADGSYRMVSNVNHALAKDGSYWWYRQYALGDTVLEGLESEA